MNPIYKKIYCCTPVAFHANELFFIRDTGLISNTLREMGIESKCIMPLPFYDDDQKKYLIRTEYKNLQSVTWWKDLGIDACILYSWGHPKYTLIARAIHKAGIKLIIHMDFSGELRSQKNAKFIKQVKSPFVNLLRRIHLGYADVITANAIAAENFRRHVLYGKKIADKVYLMSTPVSPRFAIHKNAVRRRKVVAVGRWSDNEEDRVKRPVFMICTAKAIVERDSSVDVEIYGRIGHEVQQIYNAFPQNIKDRIHLKGYTPNNTLPDIYNSAQVAICTSFSEGTHIASAEAVCCGCSLAIPPRAALKVLHWYASHESGSVADEDSPESLALSAIRELQLWENSGRNANQIASFWQPFFSIEQAVKQIFK